MTNRHQPLLRVYGDMYSGNCYKIKLLLNHLDMPHEWVRGHHERGIEDTRISGAQSQRRIPLLELPTDVTSPNRTQY